MNPYELLLCNPASEWENSTPVGNGKLGVSVFGRTDTEILQLNEESLWDGNPRDFSKDAEGFYENIRVLRKMLLTPVEEDTPDELVDADSYARKKMNNCFNRLKSYESAGELHLHYLSEEPVSEYRRILDMKRGLVSVSWKRGDMKMREEVYASCSPSVLAVRLTAEGGSLDFDLRYTRPFRTAERYETGEYMPFAVETADELLMVTSETQSKTHTLRLAAGFLTDGRKELLEDGFTVREASYAILYINMETDRPVIIPDCTAADFDRLKERAGKRMASLMERSFVRFAAEEEDIPVSERLSRMKESGRLDGSLVSVYYTFGRYLLVSSSSGNAVLPANLQGLWNPYIVASWNCNYTININLEMNYWPAQVTNLTECTVPLFHYLNDILMPEGRKIAKDFYHCRGIVAHHISDRFGFAAPGDGVWGLWPFGAAWLCYAMWEQYLFTKDKLFLRDTAYSYIRECTVFFLDYLFEDEHYPGKLLSGPSSSPENAYYRMKDHRFESHICISPAMDIEIIDGLFSMYEKMEELLRLDEKTCEEVKKAHARLMPLQIGSDGRLLEWIEEYDEYEPGHRHVSHAFGLYPGCQISENTPEYLEAMRKVFEARLSHGGGHTGWSCAWLINLFARLQDAGMTGDMLYKLFTHSTKDNLFDSHPPFQIDGNFGGTAGIAEMLVQSHTGKIRLLPALPKDLQTGSFTGIAARGGLELSADFAEGRVTMLRLCSRCRGNFILIVNGEEIAVSLQEKEEKILTF